MWTKTQAKEYHQKWRQANRERWNQYSREGRQMEAMMKRDFPVVYRKQHFARLYGDVVTQNVTAKDVVWNVYCPSLGIKLDYGFRPGNRLSQAVLWVVNEQWQFVSLAAVPRAQRKGWRKVARQFFEENFAFQK